ncbi:phosphoenolpyruvate--protein phosphotransferase [Mucilaginibacter sp. FT3.2]|uniref:phosphoenolpyruvate--protein phosphotransferase n=1 Tax=Mucilaginibacter sp. FT3.2 TaxID=2723090 RepID=UPI001621B41F|nr:phosphoenolpyruvate--protein phosphotransferase [Mucilaginibacter sp. FT3.2]MBB6231606.1 phosphotransferase system enzyme I (PtsI) [Mucilaginibacter sp. FT3.2]
MITGIGVSAGIAIGRAYLLKKQETALTGLTITDEAAIATEIEKFDKAVELSLIEVNILIDSYHEANGSEGLEILEAHIELLSDPQIKEDVAEKIFAEKKNVNDAVIEVIADAVTMFKNMEDEYMRARAADVEDIGNRILKNLSPTGKAPAHTYPPDTIIIADDLSPSDTISMDTTCIIGFATRAGGKTSHAAIIAKSRGITAVVGCGNLLTEVKNNDLLILDGQSGAIMVNPDEQTIITYQAKREECQAHNLLLKSLKDKPAITTDGIAVKLLANIANADDMEQAHDLGAEGSGLLRTELLFMGRDAFPSEDEQFEFYKAVALKAKGKPVIVRTLDIGGDKPLPYFNLPAEQNPFLGYRAIRICLDRTDIFITQLKAILRASAFGKLKIMFPMIANVQEIRAAKIVLNEAIEDLHKAGISFDKTIEIGIMIEIPSAAITADLLAKEVDFFSIGTNDLCQYTLAVDRMNEKIKDLYDPYNPGVLRLISYVIDQAHKNNIEVGMCGELASDANATLLLLGMGLREFSMSATSIPTIKNTINNNAMGFANQIYERVMAMDNSTTISAYLKEVNK